MLKELDHVAIAVPDTEAALRVWRDVVGLKVLYREVVNEGTVRLTHLDMGSTQLQLVEPLTADHPLHAWLDQRGPGLHHICFKVDDVAQAREQASAQGLEPAAAIHQGTQGRRAMFFDPASTDGEPVEITGQ